MESLLHAYDLADNGEGGDPDWIEYCGERLGADPDSDGEVYIWSVNAEVEACFDVTEHDPHGFLHAVQDWVHDEIKEEI